MAQARPRPCPRHRKSTELYVAEVLWGALALMLVLEGLLPFFSPGSWRRMFERALQLSDGQIRFIGLGSIVLGLVFLSLFWH